MLFLALADVRQTTCHPPSLLALCSSASFLLARCFSFHHSIPGCKVWNGFPRKRVSHSAGVGARVQVSGQKLRRFRGIYQPEFTKTACKRWLVERLDPPSIAEVLTLRADLPTETSKSAHSWPNLPTGADSQQPRLCGSPCLSSQMSPRGACRP